MSASRADLADLLPEKIDIDPERVEQGLAQLVLTLVEFLRQLLERQAVRRMEGGSLSEDEVERMGIALMRLEEKVEELAKQFGLTKEDLNLDLKPLGKLL
ncbi:MAG: gas vesicle protein K [Chloroflexi bacterium]|nr:gas vesicle protein K [Chloroflexota bacterium]